MLQDLLATLQLRRWYSYCLVKVFMNLNFVDKSYQQNYELQRTAIYEVGLLFIIVVCN